jgi:hypothetical protein
MPRLASTEVEFIDTARVPQACDCRGTVRELIFSSGAEPRCAPSNNHIRVGRSGPLLAGTRRRTWKYLSRDATPAVPFAAELGIDRRFDFVVKLASIS